MAHCSCINGHLLWDGDGKSSYLMYRFHFFKDFIHKHPNFLLGVGDYTEIYDCFDLTGNEKEELDCWYCHECQSIIIFNYNATIRYDYVLGHQSKDLNETDFASYEKFAILNENELILFQNFYIGLSPYQAICSYSFQFIAYLNEDKTQLFIKSNQLNKIYTYNLYQELHF